MKQSKTPVVAIPPSYHEDESINLDSTKKYIKYLYENGAKCIMSTAGTSQFNLLNIDEIIDFNEVISQFNGKHILGIPPIASKQAISFVNASNKYINNNTKFMLLYPDRYYGDNAILDYVKSISNAIGQSVYIHTPKMRDGVRGDWEYRADLINWLYENQYVCGLKEEHSNLQESYNCVNNLHPNLHIIVAGGRMRRYQYLEAAGANSFLSGIGNFAPDLEMEFINTDDIRKRCDIIQQESQMFTVFMKYGWHRSLREALKLCNLTCEHNRQPWPMPNFNLTKDINSILRIICRPLLGFNHE